ncbi:MAG TPA: PP2C family serine/threonine-protein phosphatase [Candidatus Dormibacteraeota bacterium]|nr:PP2C family serine/threonine-protein phosphatase [Candidatus Dormibacteraeota bacterium]
MEVAVSSELGARRRSNDDAYVSEGIAPGATLLAVADGFGRVSTGGSGPAALSLALVREYLRRHMRGSYLSRSLSVPELRQTLLAALRHANARLYAQSGSHEDFVAGGAALTLVLIVGSHAYVAHAGDARAYILRGSSLRRLTVDDSLFADLVPHGGAGEHAPRALLTRTLGTQPALEASVVHFELSADDQLLLCTDGIHRFVSEEEIRAALQGHANAADAVHRLAVLARSRGGVDNGTALLGRQLNLHTQTISHSSRAFAFNLSRVMASLALVWLMLITVIGFRLLASHEYFTVVRGRVALAQGYPTDIFGVHAWRLVKLYDLKVQRLQAQTLATLESTSVGSEEQADRIVERLVAK